MRLPLAVAFVGHVLGLSMVGSIRISLGLPGLETFLLAHTFNVFCLVSFHFYLFFDFIYISNFHFPFTFKLIC